MSYDTLLINTCVIYQDIGAVPDGYGTFTPDWQPVDGVEIDCRLMATTGREIVVGVEVVVADYKLFVKDTVTITEQNRVRVGAVDYEILLVSDRQDGVARHHKELWMRTAR